MTKALQIFQPLTLTSVSREAAAVLRWSGMSSWVWEWIPAGWSCHKGCGRVRTNILQGWYKTYKIQKLQAVIIINMLGERLAYHSCKKFEQQSPKTPPIARLCDPGHSANFCQQTSSWAEFSYHWCSLKVCFLLSLYIHLQCVELVEMNLKGSTAEWMWAQPIEWPIS